MSITSAIYLSYHILNSILYLYFCLVFVFKPSFLLIYLWNNYSDIDDNTIKFSLIQFFGGLLLSICCMHVLAIISNIMENETFKILTNIALSITNWLNSMTVFYIISETNINDLAIFIFCIYISNAIITTIISSISIYQYYYNMDILPNRNRQ